MSYLNSLPEDAVLLNVFENFPQTAVPLLQFHEILLRGESPLSVAERELVAAYVSGLNDCRYCQGVHTATAERFGVDSSLLTALIENFEAAKVIDKMKALLIFVKKLTQTPSRMTTADAQAVFDAGWDEKALHDAVAICALFNFMNRYVEGLGIKADESYFSFSSERLSAQGYKGLIDVLDRA